MLNGRQRIGVVATLCWVAAIVAVASVERWGNPASVFSSDHVFQFVEFVPAAEQPLRKLDPATGKLQGPTEVVSRLSPRLVLRAAILPPVLAWLLAYAVLWTVRWVRRGFKG